MDVPAPCRRPARGLTLVELITTIAIASILLAVGIPSLADLTRKNRITSATNQLIGHLRYARTEAITRGKTVTLCATRTGEGCNPNHLAWAEGYLIYVDLDQNNRFESGDPILFYQQQMSDQIVIKSSSNWRREIRFKSDGTAWGSNTTFTICDPQDSRYNREVKLYGTGRPRVVSKEVDSTPPICPSTS